MRSLVLVVWLLIAQTATPTSFPRCPEARYIDEQDFAWACRDCKCIPYYRELEEHNDPGKCGLYPFETGTWDTLYNVCRRHDAMYIYQQDNKGQVKESIIRTNAIFVGQALYEGVKGLGTFGWSIITSALVILIGTPIQVVRWVRRDRAKNGKK